MCGGGRRKGEKRAACLIGAVPFNRGREQMSDSTLLCTLPPYRCIPLANPTRNQRARELISMICPSQPWGIGRNQNPGANEKFQHRVKGCGCCCFFKDFNKQCEFACQKCSNFLTPTGSLRAAHFPTH